MRSSLSSLVLLVFYTTHTWYSKPFLPNPRIAYFSFCFLFRVTVLGATRWASCTFSVFFSIYQLYSINFTFRKEVAWLLEGSSELNGVVDGWVCLLAWGRCEFGSIAGFVIASYGFTIFMEKGS